MTTKAVTILLVDDDIVETMAVKRSFRDLKIANPTIVAHNGIEALALLRGDDGLDPVPSPCLVLPDLKMPRMGGFEFLEELRSDPVLHRTLVFVMTTSEAEEDRTRAYGNNNAGYMLKHRPGQTSWNRSACWTITGAWSSSRTDADRRPSRRSAWH